MLKFKSTTHKPREFLLYSVMLYNLRVKALLTYEYRQIEQNRKNAPMEMF